MCRKKFDAIKYDLKKVEEVVYDLSIRGLSTQARHYIPTYNFFTAHPPQHKLIFAKREGGMSYDRKPAQRGT